MAELRKLTTYCKFEDTKDCLEELLHDRFVCGLRNEGTRKCLLTEKTLTFTQAIDVAQNHETAFKDAQMKAVEQLPSGNSTVHKVMSLPQKEGCYRCGLKSHKANDCRFKEATCHNCGKNGFFFFL